MVILKSRSGYARVLPGSNPRPSRATSATSPPVPGQGIARQTCGFAKCLLVNSGSTSSCGG